MDREELFFTPSFEIQVGVQIQVLQYICRSCEDALRDSFRKRFVEDLE